MHNSFVSRYLNISNRIFSGMSEMKIPLPLILFVYGHVCVLLSFNVLDDMNTVESATNINLLQSGSNAATS